MSDVEGYIARQKSPQKEIIKKVRKIILKTFPRIRETMYGGVPCYEGKYYIAALKKQVNLGFSIKGLTKKEISLFEGTGKLMRHIKLNSLEDVDEGRIVKLLKLVKAGLKEFGGQ